MHSRSAGRQALCCRQSQPWNLHPACPCAFLSPDSYLLLWVQPFMIPLVLASIFTLALLHFLFHKILDLFFFLKSFLLHKLKTVYKTCLNNCSPNKRNPKHAQLKQLQLTRLNPQLQALTTHVFSGTHLYLIIQLSFYTFIHGPLNLSTSKLVSTTQVDPTSLYISFTR